MLDKLEAHQHFAVMNATKTMRESLQQVMHPNANPKNIDTIVDILESALCRMYMAENLCRDIAKEQLSIGK